jgi:hypothetical protein
MSRHKFARQDVFNPHLLMETVAFALAMLEKRKFQADPECVSGLMIGLRALPEGQSLSKAQYPPPA